MKKIISFTIFALFVLTLLPLELSGCTAKNEYESAVSLLRADVYSGSYGDVAVSAEYGFKEYPFVNDGASGERVYGYTFIIHAVADEIKRSVTITIDEKTYSADFKVDEISSEYKAFIETPDKHLPEFTAVINSGSDTREVAFCSLLPENTISYTDALNALKTKQKPLLDAFTADGIFKAELYLKIFVKNEKPYWYVGIAYAENRLKALLVDGITAEILAIREIA